MIVYVSGCWDLFHIGHLNFLEKVKKLGDVLIVGVNTDEMILQYKGYAPVMPYEQRKRIVEALKCVNKAVPHYLNEISVFDEYGIGIVARGPNYGTFEHHIREKEYLEKTGRRIMTFPETKGISTTSIVKRIKGRKRI